MLLMTFSEHNVGHQSLIHLSSVIWRCWGEWPIPDSRIRNGLVAPLNPPWYVWYEYFVNLSRPCAFFDMANTMMCLVLSAWTNNTSSNYCWHYIVSLQCIAVVLSLIVSIIAYPTKAPNVIRRRLGRKPENLLWPGLRKLRVTSAKTYLQKPQTSSGGVWAENLKIFSDQDYVNCRQLLYYYALIYKLEILNVFFFTRHRLASTTER